MTMNATNDKELTKEQLYKIHLDGLKDRIKTLEDELTSLRASRDEAAQSAHETRNLNGGSLMPDPITDAEMNEVLALAEKASPGPWICELNDIADVWMIGHKDDYNFASVYFDNASEKHKQPGRDAAYIAAAHPAFVTRLITELLSLRKASHSVSQCCPESERLAKRVEELEAITEQLPTHAQALPWVYYFGGGCCAIKKTPLKNRDGFTFGTWCGISEQQVKDGNHGDDCLHRGIVTCPSCRSEMNKAGIDTLWEVFNKDRAVGGIPGPSLKVASTEGAASVPPNPAPAAAESLAARGAGR